MAQIQHKVILCNSAWTELAILSYQNLQYRTQINGADQAYFEMQIQNPVFRQINFDFFNNTYNIKIMRGSEIKFRGELDEMLPADTKGTNNDALLIMDRIGFRASAKLDAASRIIVTPDSGSEYYRRTFTNVGLGTIAQTVMQEAIARTNSPLSGMTIGTIENPVNQAGAAITLPPEQELTAYDTLTLIDILAYIGDADYYMNGDAFNFVKRKGIRRPEVAFRLHFGEPGNNLTSLKVQNTKRDLYNKIILLGAGTGVEFKITEAQDAAHQQRMGLREKVFPARAIDTADTLSIYAKSLLKQYTEPERFVVFTPSLSSTPLAGFELGDEVSLDVDWFIYKFVKWMRVIGLTTYVDDIGVERLAYEMTAPKVLANE